MEKRLEKDEPHSYASTRICCSPDVTANSHATSNCAASCTGSSDTNAETPSWPVRPRLVRNTATQNGSAVLEAVNLKTEEHNFIPTKLIPSMYLCLIRTALVSRPQPHPYTTFGLAMRRLIVLGYRKATARYRAFSS